MPYSCFKSFNSSLLPIQSNCSDFSVTQRVSHIWSPHFYLVFFPHPVPSTPNHTNLLTVPELLVTALMVLYILLFVWILVFFLVYLGSLYLFFSNQASISFSENSSCSSLYLVKTQSISHYAVLVYIFSLLLN